MNSETQLKIIHTTMSLLVYLPIILLLFVVNVSFAEKISLLILFLSPKVYTDLKKEPFKIDIGIRLI